MSRILLLLLPIALVLSAGAASAACLDTETLVQGKCVTRQLSRFSIETLKMTGEPNPAPPALPNFNVGTIEMTGGGGPPSFNVGTIEMTGGGGPPLFTVGTIQMTGIVP